MTGKSKLVLTDENIPYVAAALEHCCRVSEFKGRNLTNEDIVSLDPEFLIVRSTTKVNEELLANSAVRFVGSATSGIDHIDTQYLENKGIYFDSAPGSNANSVAEYVVYSILRWANDNEMDIANKTIGIIGYGNIGRIVASYAREMRLEVIINDPPLRDEGFTFPDWARYSNLDELFSESDIVTNHVPLTTSGNHPTSGLIGYKKLESLKRGSLIIHASRGGVIDEAPLYKLLKNCHLHAAVDVWKDEPLPDKELAELCFLSTPHIAGYSKDGKIRGAMKMVRSLAEFAGLKPDFSELKKESDCYAPINRAKFVEYEYLYELLKDSRKLDNDSVEFRGILDLPDKKKSERFDQLRKEYPVRREVL